VRIKLTCLSCGHLFELGDAYESYTGQIRCWGCRATLDVALLEGKLQSMQMHENAVILVLPASPAPPAPDIEVLILPQATLPEAIVAEEVLAEERRPRRKAR
jgi:hypothetical protein